MYYGLISNCKMKSPGPFRCNVKVTKKCQHLSVKVKGGRGFSSPYSPPVQNEKALDNNPRYEPDRQGRKVSALPKLGKRPVRRRKEPR